MWLIVATTACGHPTPMEELLGARALTPAPSSDGACLFDLTDGKADTVFFVLGMLDEYSGRYLVEGDDRVETFYCNETGPARLFRRHISKLTADQRFDPTIAEETIQNCVVVFRSTPIASHLNSCYRYTMTGQSLAQAHDGTYRRTASASLAASELFGPGRSGINGRGLSDKTARRRALAYVAGAWARYGRGAEFVFANARDKVTLVADLLTNLGCHDVRIESSSGTIPQANRIRFEPTEEVKEWLRKNW